MTIQEQADAILQDGWRAHLASQDELLARLAQDRDALLKACKGLTKALHDAGYQVASISTKNSHLEKITAAFSDGIAAIAQAERPR